MIRCVKEEGKKVGQGWMKIFIEKFGAKYAPGKKRYRNV